MKFKRILALVFCVVAFSAMLVGCEEDVTQKWLDYYKENDIGQPKEIEDVVVDLYIIKGEDMSADANITKTVQDKMNQYFYLTYHTNVKIHYISASDYAAEIDKLTAESKGIVLIDSEETMDKLSGKLIDINPYLVSDDFKGRGYGKLNKQITTALLNAARVVENGVEKLYCIPNNHVIGSYEYIVINKAAASSLLYANSTLAEMTSWELTESLRNDAALNLDSPIFIEEVDYKDYDPASGAVVTRVVNAPYEAKAAIEAGNMIVNIAKYPVADKAEAYSSAFGILKGTAKGAKDNAETTELTVYTERAMQIIYEINSNKNIRNLLQYGVENVNYSLDKNGVVVPIEDKRYDMNILHTGDVFVAHYSEYWTALDAENGLKQNKDTDK